MNASTEGILKCIRAASSWAVAVLLLTAAGTNATPQAPLTRYDTQSTGRARGWANDPTFTWSIGANSPTTPVIGADGTLYFGAADRCFYAYTAQGAMKWMYRTAAGISGNSAIAADGTVYVGATGSIVALTASGSEKWASPFKFTATSAPGSIVVDGSGTIYFGADDKRLYAVNPDGSLKWSCLTGGAVRYGVSVSPDGSTIYATAADGWVYAIRSADGSIAWRSGAISAMYNPAVGDDGSLYVGSTNGKLYSYSASGSLNWTFQMQSKVTCAPALAKDGTIYIGSQDMNLYALDPTGQMKWLHRTGGPIYSAPTIDGGGRVVFGAWRGKLCSLDPVDGTLEWYRSLGAAIYAPPMLDSSGAIYVVSIDGTITKYNSLPIPAETPEPSTVAGLAALISALCARSRARRRRNA